MSGSDAGFEFGYRDPESPEERTRLEARNSYRLTVAALELAVVPSEFSLTPAMILELHRITVQDIDPEAGQFRRKPRFVASHVTPKASEVPGLIAAMCDHVNGSDDAFYSAAFSLWRLNWIHPFSDGNGRVARVLAWLCICRKLTLISGRFLSELDARRDQYYAALESADRSWAQSDQDYSDPDVARDLEQLLIDIYAGITG